MGASRPGRLAVTCFVLALVAGLGLAAPASRASEGTPVPGGATLAPVTPAATSASSTPGVTPRPTIPAAHSQPATIPPFLEQTENILILGTDQREAGGGWRTDTMMVAAIDYERQRVGLISIPRDLYVQIPGTGWSRLNQADYLGEAQKYPGGGPALTGKLIQDNLGIPTQHWVRLKYNGLPRLVDALGGVTVHLDCPLYERTPHPTLPGRYVDWSLPAGDVLLDGATAKKFVTYRYLTNDSGRARRQQQLIWAMREKALQLNMVPKIPELWQALSDVFSTDLSLLDILRLARMGASLQPGELHGLVVGMEVMGNYITPSGGWVLVIRDRAMLESELTNLFSGRPLADLAHNQAPNGKCPPMPRSFTAPTPTPTTTAPTPTTTTP